MIDTTLVHTLYDKPSTQERKPPVMIAKNNRVTKQQRKNRQDKEKERIRDKANSPGVPPNSCPYIDMTKTIIDDLAAAYERLYEKGEHQPKFDDMKQLADDMLEYIRRANECLRDNSAYWYNKYKANL